MDNGAHLRPGPGGRNNAPREHSEGEFLGMGEEKRLGSKGDPQNGIIGVQQNFAASVFLWFSPQKHCFWAINLGFMDFGGYPLYGFCIIQ